MSYTQNRLKNRITVGVNGNYKTLKEAVDWFNSNATSTTEILLDAGHHAVADTIHIHNTSYDLQIRGLGSSVTSVDATTGLASKPMFNVASNCDFNKMTCVGGNVAAGGLSGYGVGANENCFTFNTTTEIYSEITDLFIDTFTIGVADLIGVDIFLFNFVILTCTTGILVSYSTIGIATTNIDIETGNIEHCTTGINFNTALQTNFTILNVIFKHLVSPAATAILYNGTTFVVGEITQIFSCTWNNRGTFLSGFDFTRSDGRDANIEVIGNSGCEDKQPHAKINLIDETITTTCTTTPTYYKIAGVNSKWNCIFNAAATAGTYTITVGAQTTASIAWNASVATIKAALELLTNVGTVTVVAIVANKEWTIEFLTADEGWSNHPVTYNIAGLTTTTSVALYPSFYTCKLGITNNRWTVLSDHPKDGMVWISGNVSSDQTNRLITIGIRKNNAIPVISPFTARTTTANIPYQFSFCAYLEDMVKTDYYELVVSTANSGDVIRVWDMTILISCK